MVSFLWIFITGMISPFWLGGTYMSITGNGKGVGIFL
jgi:hypothetical protein